MPQRFLGNNWISPLPKAVQQAVIDKMRLKTYSKGEAIYREGAVGHAMWQLQTGSVRVTNTHADGKEVVFTIFEAGDCFGEISMIDGKPASNTATAIENSEVMELSRADYESLYQQHPEIAQQLNIMLTQRMRHMFNFYEDIALRPLEMRLAHRLCYLTGHLPNKNTLEQASYEINVTQQDISAMLGATRQAVSKILNQWRDEELIRIEYGKIIIVNADALAKLAQ